MADTERSPTKRPLEVTPARMDTDEGFKAKQPRLEPTQHSAPILGQTQNNTQPATHDGQMRVNQTVTAEHQGSEPSPFTLAHRPSQAPDFGVPQPEQQNNPVTNDFGRDTGDRTGRDEDEMSRSPSPARSAGRPPGRIGRIAPRAFRDDDLYETGQIYVVSISLHNHCRQGFCYHNIGAYTHPVAAEHSAHRYADGCASDKKIVLDNSLEPVVPDRGLDGVWMGGPWESRREVISQDRPYPMTDLEAYWIRIERVALHGHVDPRDY